MEKKEKNNKLLIAGIVGACAVMVAIAVWLMLGSANKSGEVTAGVVDLPSTQAVSTGSGDSDDSSDSDSDDSSSDEASESEESDAAEPVVVETPVSDSFDISKAAVVDEIVDGKLFHAVVNADIVMVDGGMAEMQIQNLADSEYPCYVVIDEIIEKSETGSDLVRCLYDSAVVDPGYKLESDSLMYRLGPGEHECTAGFFVLDSEGGAIQRLNVPVTITCK